MNGGPRPKVLPHRRATLKLIDEAIGLAEDPTLQEGNEVCERSIQLIYGGADDQGILLDVLTLARIALVHLRGASYLVHEGKNQEPEESG